MPRWPKLPTLDREGYRLTLPQLARTIDTMGEESVFDSARRAGVRIVGACGGRGTCGSCVVRLIDGELHQSDTAIGATVGSQDRWVRACQIRAVSHCTLEIAPRSLAPIVRAEDDSDSFETLALDATVVGIRVEIPESSLEDPRADAERLLVALDGLAESVDLVALRRLPCLLREHGWSLRAYVRERQVIGLACGDQPLLGLAVDLGTTNVAGYLINLETGGVLARLGIENPQVAWGADVISRLNHAAASTEAASELGDAAVTAINTLGHDLCRAIDASPDDIVDLVVCGNTAMQHLLLELPVRQLGRAPFVAVTNATVEVKARELGLNTCPGANVRLVANVGGFVGGDLIAALLATEAIWRDTETALVMDIGTNTEIALIHRGEIICTSCPSGPALEGGHISCGMRAAEGAIEHVEIGEDGRITVRTIADKTPLGLCGSGVLDAVASLSRAGLIDRRGRILTDHPDIEEIDGQRRVVLAPDVFLTQLDVRAVQLAKAAIRTGVELLLHTRGLGSDAIERLVIAGAFGAYIQVESGIAVGLFPALPRERFIQVGNAAGIGARRMLASGKARHCSDVLSERCCYLELSTRGDFQNRFIGNIGF